MRIQSIKEKTNITKTGLAGVLVGMAFAPFHISPGCFFISFLANRIQRSVRLSQAIKHAFAFSLCYHTLCLYWIAAALFVDIEAFWWGVPFALFGIPLGISVFFLAIVGCWSFAFRHSRFYILHFIASWMSFEYILHHVPFGGFPWINMVHTVSCCLYLAQGIKFLGYWGMSFVVLYISCSFYSRQWLHALCSCLMCLSITVCGYIVLKENATQFHNVGLVLVQPSIDQQYKWDENRFIEQLDLQIELSNHSNTSQDTIIIWPEAAVPSILTNKLLDFLRSQIQKRDVLIFGGIRESEGKIYTGAYSIDNKGLEFMYDKKHLVPFGEYVPRYFGFVHKITHGNIDYSPGSAEAALYEIFNLKIRPLVCYELIFNHEIGEGADLIVHITNDAWYGRSSGPYQHFEIAKIRAIEKSIPVVRVGNNGITGIIDQWGRVIVCTELDDVNSIISQVPKISYDNYDVVMKSKLMVKILIVFITAMYCIFNKKYLKV